ncbi:sirohydrochlorin cobaltochelatase [Veillonella caviae]|uniref:sirohydrochlorin cobaltochelatase n=1 Tax=Veillonella caviae TaxID=248316 RepID=UPI0023F97F67|nr:sirohydrochlorin cobaltochelatase [Veillonella caviae]MCI7694435.1 sirohydrochlorin cobaltochelatase [Veillonella caviae]MDD7291097.1 sirohydrochlorin cobaltochelatase [Veillonella caviae]MDY5254083.1 sirohydrochlorin cobaltochelatase [Veillonella caviae]MDY5787377.1 sirohydrochlorin cobaltochelatase [Veillonella caviae]
MKGIIIASFGSIYKEAVNTSIGVIESKVRTLYSNMEVRRVFLSDALVDKWNDKYDEHISSFTEVMQEFNRMGIDEVYIQPITLVADQCYQQMRKQALKFLHSSEYGFTQISIGKPLLTSLGIKNYADDYEATLDGILRHVNTKALNKSIILMANGQNQLEFSTLQLKAMYGAAPNVAVFTTNGFPTFKQALTLVDRMGHQDVLVVPLALIGSAHLMDYLGGERSDSIYALLAEEGYNVDIWNEGLGENPYVQDLFLKHLGQAVRMSDRKRNSRTESVQPMMTSSRMEVQSMIS